MDRGFALAQHGCMSDGIAEQESDLYYCLYYIRRALNMRTISFRLDDHADGVLAAYCERHGVTQTGALKAAIELLSEVGRPTPAELAHRVGLIGSFRSAEGDLAENHSQRVKERLRAKHGRDAMPAKPPAVEAPAARVRRPSAR